MKITALVKQLMLLALIIASACSKSGDRAGEVDMPELDSTCRSGQCVKGQFETAYQRFALITGDAVNLRTRPDVTSRVLMQLPVTRKVTVLYVKPEEVTIGAMKGRWAFVRDAVNISLQGWLFDQFLAYAGSFTKPDHWKLKEIRVILGDWLTVYQCSPDCRFDIIQNEMLYKKDGKKTGDKITGDILRYKNVVWLKKDRPDDYPVFFHELSTGKLDLPDQYKGKRGVVLVK